MNVSVDGGPWHKVVMQCPVTGETPDTTLRDPFGEDDPTCCPVCGNLLEVKLVQIAVEEDASA